MSTYLDFEKPIAELERKIVELKELSEESGIEAIDKQILRLEETVERNIKNIYSALTPWQKTQIARHPERPRFKDYAVALLEDFIPLAGDRKFAEDHAIIGGLARFNNESVIVIGQEKGHDTESRIRHNFGMAKPEGYRKAVRLMEMAARFRLPILSFIDTSGAYPGIGAEERGQAEAIATSIEACLSVDTPFIGVIIGEGGSGGAMALATADRVFMMEHSIYSVISPEGAAAILWRGAEKAPIAASTMKITAQDLLGNGIIDGIIPEPVGGAHRHRERAIENVGKMLEESLAEEMQAGEEQKTQRIQRRKEKFLKIGRA